jgi:SET domain-containing protein
MQIPNLYIAPSELEGRGVYCGDSIEQDSVIEVCPLVIIPAKEMPLLKQTNLYNYYFEWKENAGAIALGYGSLYNHAYVPNARYVIDEDFDSLTVIAITNIPAGTEIRFNYNGDIDNQTKVWFDKK